MSPYTLRDDNIVIIIIHLHTRLLDDFRLIASLVLRIVLRPSVRIVPPRAGGNKAKKIKITRRISHSSRNLLRADMHRGGDNNMIFRVVDPQRAIGRSYAFAHVHVHIAIMHLICTHVMQRREVGKDRITHAKGPSAEYYSP